MIRAVLTPFNLVFLAILVVYGAAIYALTYVYDAPAFFTTSFYSISLHWATLFFVLFFISYRAFYVMIAVRPRHLTKAIYADMKSYLTAERLLSALPLLIMVPVFFSLFTTAKNMIPLINPFSWDPVFAQWERILHFGYQPWEWLQPVLGFAAITLSISLFYKLWFVIKFFVMYWQAFSLKYPAWREQFFIALALIWIINGTILATWLSSAGPCYFALAYPGLADPYADLMTYLRAVNIFDLPAMDYLWGAYEGRAAMPFSGISAMPSMHVSVACLYALLGWRYGGAIRWGLFAFLILTFVGSVHLGWHYAMDGYLSLLTTPPIWWLSGWIVRRWRGRA